MQCLHVQRLDLIPLSPKLPGFDTHFGAAFCHVRNQLCLREGTEKATIQPRTFRFADSPQNHHWHSQSISESIFHGATQRQNRLSASLQLSLVLARHKSPSSPFPPPPPAQALVTPSVAASPPPRGLQSMPGSPDHYRQCFFCSFLVLPVQNCRRQWKLPSKFIFHHVSKLGGVCARTKAAPYLITHPLNHPCPLECPISLGNESGVVHNHTHGCHVLR